MAGVLVGVGVGAAVTARKRWAVTSISSRDILGEPEGQRRGEGGAAPRGREKRCPNKSAVEEERLAGDACYGGWWVRGVV